MAETEQGGFWAKVRHAFAVGERCLEPPTELQRELIERLCWAIVRRQLTPAAGVLLEMARPLNYLGAQSLHFLEPVATAIFSRTEYQEFARFLERRDAMDLILSQLDALQSGKADRD